MKMLFVMTVCIASVLVVSCRKQDIRTVVVKVPGLRNQECARILQDAFMRQPAVRSALPDLQNGALVITYDSMGIALKNLEFVIAAAGFDANDVRAKPEAVAKLPPECREEQPVQ